MGGIVLYWNSGWPGVHDPAHFWLVVGIFFVVFGGLVAYFCLTDRR